MKHSERVAAALICAALAGACGTKNIKDSNTSGGGAGSGGMPNDGQPGSGGAGPGGAGMGAGTGTDTGAGMGTGTAGMGTGTGSGGSGSGVRGTGGAGGKDSATKSDGSGGTGGSTPDGGTGGSDAAPDDTSACGSKLLAVPDDPGVRGPWDVGVRTATVGRLTVEVLYPAQPGSTDGLPEATYDIRDWLPAQERDKVPADHSPAVGPIGGHLYRDVPVDADHGPYPVVIFIHGTASFRIASGSTNVHWASRGFVVLAADYPGLGLADQLASVCGYAQSGDQDVEGDVTAQIQALTDGSGDLAFLKDHVDMKRLGISGHSQGACMTATLSTVPNVQIVIPMDGSTAVSSSSSLKSIMYISGMEDTVIGYDGIALGNVVCPPNPLPATSDMDGYLQSPGQPDVIKRIVGITGGGHLTPTDLCQTNAQGLNAIQEAEADGVCGIDTAVIIGLPALFDCGVSGFDWQKGVAAVNYASTAALEETLYCKDRSAQFANMTSAVPEIGDFQHEP